MNEQTVTVTVPFAIRKRGGRKLVLAPDGSQVPPRDAPQIQNAIVKLLVRAFRWRKLLESNAYATVGELALAEGIDPSYLGRALRLTLLAPDIVEAIPDGRQPEGMTLPEPMQGVRVEWEVWREQLGGRPQSGARLAERDRYTDFSDRGAFASCSAELE